MSAPSIPVPRRTFAIALCVALLLALLSSPPWLSSADAADHVPAPDEPETEIDRLSGPTRIETAIAISNDAYPDGSADTVVLARADVYADALAGAPLATALGAPILLTDSDSVPGGVLAEIGRLGASDALVLGGTAAIDDGVVGVLEDAGLDVERVGGANRFGTAAAIAEEIGEDADQVFIVEGQHVDAHRGWPDAVSSAPYAAWLGAPILLVRAGSIPSETQAAVEALDPGNVVIIGGTVAVSADVEESLAEDWSVRRLSGADRFETSGAVYDEAISLGMDPGVRWLATGRNWPDALAAGATVGALGDSLLLIDPDDISARSPGSAVRIAQLVELLERVVLLGGTAAISDAAAAEVADLVAPEVVDADYCLTVLHNNDGESALLNAGIGLEDFGSIGRFGTVVFRERARALADRDDGCDERGVLTVSSGDNFLAGPEWQASQEKGVPFYDSIALDYIGYDALAIGNHDFDFGPEVAAQFMEGFAGDAVFLSANLDVSGEPDLQALADDGRIAGSVLLDVGSRQIGVIGAVTPILRSISSPRNVQVDPDVAGAIEAEKEALLADGADILVLISHLQGLTQDLELIPELSDLDIIVAGGGDEVLGSPGNLYIPGEEAHIADTYPFWVEDADGIARPVVTTAGSYRYLGRLVTRFGEDDNLLPGGAGVNEQRSRMVRVADASLPDGVERDAFLVEQVEEPVAEFVAELAETVVGVSQVALEGRRPAIRVEETNLGNLMADALRSAAEDRAAEFGIDDSVPFVGLQNGGGIRNDTLIPAGNITRLDAFAIAPFPNFVSVVEDVTPAELKLLLENAYSGVERVDGRFGHLSNLRVEVDLSRDPQTHDDDAQVVNEGDRVRNVWLGDDTPLIENGAPAAGAPDVHIATIDFLARGGDQYPFPDPEDGFTTVGVAYEQALSRHIMDELGGVISAADYPEGGEGRITFIE
jgi:5'-nucleotidase / UDP-sugar diphosphatase